MSYDLYYDTERHIISKFSMFKFRLYFMQVYFLRGDFTKLSLRILLERLAAYMPWVRIQ